MKRKKSASVVLMGCGGLLTLCGMVLSGSFTRHQSCGLVMSVWLVFMVGVVTLMTGIVVDAFQGDPNHPK